MKRFIRKFSQANRSICHALERRFPRFFCSSHDFGGDLHRIIVDDLHQNKRKVVLEVGGIDRPILSRSNDYRYVGLDIEERKGCYTVYDAFLVQSVEDPIPVKADLVISTTLLEHVPNNTKSIAAIYGALNEDGFTAHYIPSKYHFYSILLRLVGPRLQKILIGLLRPEAEMVTGYPAFFNKCSPAQMEATFQSSGFHNVKVIPYYRATDYFAFFVPAFFIVSVLENIIEKMGIRALCSGFIITAQKGPVAKIP